MKKFYLVLSLTSICLGCSISTLSAVSVRTPPVDIDVGPYGYYYEDPYYHVWVGPGWYYGIYFSSEDRYYYWLENNFYGVNWDGPGWYYGIYFDSRPDFYRYRYNHRTYRGRYKSRYRQNGSSSFHQAERRGRWSRNKPKN